MSVFIMRHQTCHLYVLKIILMNDIFECLFEYTFLFTLIDDICTVKTKNTSYLILLGSTASFGLIYFQCIVGKCGGSGYYIVYVYFIFVRFVKSGCPQCLSMLIVIVIGLDREAIKIKNSIAEFLKSSEIINKCLKIFNIFPQFALFLKEKKNVLF